MARKSNPNKRPIPNKVRVRMYRQRKKLKSIFREREHQMDTINQNVIAQANPSNENVEPTLRIEIRDWASVHKLSKRSIDDLLAILVSSGIDSIPKNHRTLQRTPTDIKINKVAGGSLWINGLEKCLQRIFSTLDRSISISLNFNIDGLPLYKSLTINFYPILAAINGK